MTMPSDSLPDADLWIPRSAGDQRILYIENWFDRIRSSDKQGHVFLLTAVNRYTTLQRLTGERVDPAKVRDILNIGEKDLETLNKLASDVDAYRAGGRSRDYIETALKFLNMTKASPASKLLLEVLGPLTQLGFMAADTLLGPGAQTEAQKKSRYMVENFQAYARSELSELLRNADGNSYLREGFDDFYTALVGTSTTASIKDLIAGNPRLQVLLSQRDLKKVLNEVLSTLNDSADVENDLLKRGLDYGRESLELLKGLVALAARQTDDDAEKAELERQITLENNRITRERLNHEAVMDLAVSLLHFQDPTAAAIFRRGLDLGESTGKILHLLSNKEIASFAAIASIGSNVLNFISFVESMQHPDQFSVLARELRGIQELMLEMHQSISARLDRVDQGIRNLSALVSSVLGQIADQGRVLGEMRDTLFDISNRISGIETQVLRAIRSIPELELRSRFKTCLHRQSHADLDITVDQFTTYCLDNFWSWGTDVASSPLFVDEPQAIDKLDLLAGQLSQRTFFERLSMLQGISSALSMNEDMVQASRVPNPVVWAVGAAAYLQAIETWPEHTQSANLKSGALRDLVGIGEIIQQAVLSLASETARATVWPKLFKLYDKAVSDLLHECRQGEVQARSSKDVTTSLEIFDISVSTASAIKKFDLNGFTNARDLQPVPINADSMQTVWFSFLQTHRNDDFPGEAFGRKLTWPHDMPPPAEITRFLPPLVVAAHHLGLISLSLHLQGIVIAPKGKGEARELGIWREHEYLRDWLSLGRSENKSDLDFQPYDGKTFTWRGILPVPASKSFDQVKLIFWLKSTAREKNYLNAAAANPQLTTTNMALYAFVDLDVIAPYEIPTTPDVISGSALAGLIWNSAEHKAIVRQRLEWAQVEFEKLSVAILSNWGKICERYLGRILWNGAMGALPPRARELGWTIETQWMQRFVAEENQWQPQLGLDVDDKMNELSHLAAQSILNTVEQASSTSGRIQTKAAELDGVRSILEDFFRYAFHDELIVDDVLRVVLFGQNRLASSHDILTRLAAAIEAKRMMVRVPLTEIFQEAKSIASFRQEAVLVTLTSYAGQASFTPKTPSFLGDTLSRLQLAIKKLAGFGDLRVIKNTPFFLYGPHQGQGANGDLAQGTRLGQLPDSIMNYVHVITEDGVECYVNEDDVVSADI